MSFLTEWITSIIIFILLATVIDMLLPNSSMQKYAKMVIGLLLIVVILTPILKILSTDMDELFASMTTNSINISEKNIKNLTDSKKREIQALHHAYTLEQMADKMKDQVEEELMEQYGLKVKSINPVVKDGPLSSLPEDDFLEYVEVLLVDAETVTAISTVKPVTIDTSKPLERKEENEGHEKVQAFLSEQWQLHPNIISVAVEGGKR